MLRPSSAGPVRRLMLAIWGFSSFAVLAPGLRLLVSWPRRILQSRKVNRLACATGESLPESAMMSISDEPTKTETAGKGQPRFGSYIGLIFVIGILGILSFAILRDDAGIGHAFTKLKPGMTPTEVAAVLGVPRSETKTGPSLVQTWRMPDGVTFEVRFQNGRLTSKELRDGVGRAP